MRVLHPMLMGKKLDNSMFNEVTRVRCSFSPEKVTLTIRWGQVSLITACKVRLPFL